MNFKHIIITRFNLSKRWNADKYGNQVLNKSWLEARYFLFEKYCLPSIKSQTNQNFEWWVYFDSSMDSYYKIKNNIINEEYSNFIPKYEETYNHFEQNMPQDISTYIKLEQIDWLITTRLDNDDVFAVDTVEVIQSFQNFQDNTLLELPFGYTLEINFFSKLRKVESYLNPFISLVEEITNRNQIKSVYYYQHNHWKNVNRIVASKREQWMQVIHEKNVSNKADGKEVFCNDIYDRFKIKDENLKLQPYLFFMTRKFKLKISYLFRKLINRLK